MNEPLPRQESLARSGLRVAVNKSGDLLYSIQTGTAVQHSTRLYILPSMPIVASLPWPRT